MLFVVSGVSSSFSFLIISVSLMNSFDLLQVSIFTNVFNFFYFAFITFFIIIFAYVFNNIF